MTPEELDAIINGVISLVEENKKLRESLSHFGVPRRFILGANNTGADRPNRPKLSKYDAKDIRRAYVGGMKQADLARGYNVHPATISRIVRGIYH